MVFNSVDEAGESGWTDWTTTNQAAEEAAIASNCLVKYLPMPPPTPPASGLSKADIESQSIMENIIHSANCLPTSSTPAQIDSIPAALSACSSLQQSPGSSAGHGIDASGNEPYCVGYEPCQSTIQPLQWADDSYISSSPSQCDYGNSSPYDDMSGLGSDDNDDDSNDSDHSSYAHNNAQCCETSSSEKEAADYDSKQPTRKRRRITQSLATNMPSCETSCSKEDAADYDSDQPPRKRIKVTKSLTTNTSSRGCTPRFPASTELVKQMGKIIPSSSMLSLASSLAQDSSNNGDAGAADATIYEEVTFSGCLRFSSVDGTIFSRCSGNFPKIQMEAKKAALHILLMQRGVKKVELLHGVHSVQSLQDQPAKEQDRPLTFHSVGRRKIF
ncbi:hypothetical protein V8C42DRAFT_336691 [Trichoderma barbatum]